MPEILKDDAGLNTGASADAETGSREPSPSSTGLGPTGFDPARLRLERYDADCTRILDGDGKVVALIEALSNGRWMIFTTDDYPYAKRSFGTVRLAFAWFRGRLLDDASAMSAGTAETEGLRAKPASAARKAGDAP